MRPLQKSALLLSLCIATGCSSGNETTPPTAESSARIGVGAAATLSIENLLESPTLRPAAVLGVYAAHFLGSSATVQAKSALDGIAAQMQLYLGQTVDAESGAAVMEQLGTTLQVDIVELLNRSTDRAEALDGYIAFLEGAMVEATAAFDNLETQVRALNTDLSARKKESSTLRREVDKAIRDKDFSLAGAKQQLLGIADVKVAELESQKQQMTGAQDLLEELLDIAEERHTAITQNRDALIAGVKVVDVPGVSDLGILQKGLRRR